MRCPEPVPVAMATRSSSTHSQKERETSNKRLCVNRYVEGTAAPLVGGFGGPARTRWQVGFVSTCPPLTSETSAATAGASRFPRFESREEAWE